MNWYKYTIRIPEQAQELLIAELAEIGFNAFLQDPEALQVYLPEAQRTESTVDTLREILQARSLPAEIREEQIREINWNEEWERSIEPVRTGPFLIHTSWTTVEAKKGDIRLIIDPKMSFGTGLHPTTRLMLQLLANVMTRNPAEILDVGTGTGILAIAAARLGAKRVLGFDIDPWSERNALENISINGVGDRVEIFSGTIEDLPNGSGPWELIMANINRNTILELADTLLERLSPEGGVLLLSGLLKSDRNQVLERFLNSGAKLTNERTEGEWVALRFDYDTG